VFNLELWDLPHKINQTINKVVKEAVHIALQALLRDRFRELPEADMKEILHQRMFKSGSYKLLTKHVALYKALEDQKSLQLHSPQLGKRMTRDKLLLADDVNISDSEDIDAAHLLKIKTRPDWLKPVPEEDRPETPEPYWIILLIDVLEKKLRKIDLEGLAFKVVKSFHENSISLQFHREECHRLLTDQVDLVNTEGHRLVSDVSKLLRLRGSPAYGITHWWFKRKDFYITTHNAPSDYHAVRSHMRILSVISIKTFERYVYTFLKEIVICRADYNEYKISEADFKNLHLNDLEDMYLLHLQGKLNHLPGSDKVCLYNILNLWIRNIVIKQRVGDLQLGIGSYQTKLNLTKPRWDASYFLFKEDYTIISKPRAMIYRDRNDQKKMLRENEVHKFSDGTLTRVLHKLYHMFKDFRLYQYNLGMEYIIWSKDDKRRSEAFMVVIERRLKIQRIFQRLESFVGGRLRDVDYRTLNRTE
nr:hypothetical protein [Tanacetum cinerariifolium]